MDRRATVDWFVGLNNIALLHGNSAERYDQVRFIPWGCLDAFYEAVVQSVEEAVANALVANEDVVGRDGRRSPTLPRERVARLMKP